MAECNLDNCNEECFEDNDKCILHCGKDDWYENLVFKKDWAKSTKNLNKFWKTIQKSLDEIYIHAKDYEPKILDDKLKYINVIFPKFQKDIKYCTYSDNEDETGTNFYSYGIFEEIHSDETPYPHTHQVFNELEIIFDNCIFLDKADFLKYEFSKSITFINQCTFFNSVSLPSKTKTHFRNVNFKVNIKVNNLNAKDEVLFYDCNFFGNINFSEKTMDSNLFKHCNFHGDIDGKNVTFKGQLFNNDTLFFANNYERDGYYVMQNIKLVHCIFKKPFYINNLSNLPIYDERFNIYYINFFNSVFEEEVMINKSNINSVYLNNTKFNGITIFNDINLNEFVCNNTVFNDILLFNKNTIQNNIDFSNTKFMKSSSFSENIVKGTTNFRTSFSNGSIDFLDYSSSVANRETARIIKNSFEQQNNIIEANKYYALEMDKRKEELAKDIKKNLFEWTIFKVHEISSNHSQDWLLALFWIFYIGFTASILDFYMMQDTELRYIHYNFDKLKITWIISLVTIFTAYTLTYRNKLFHTVIWIGFYLIYTFTFKDMTLNHFANIVNPFSIMTKGDSLNLGMLIFKVIIAYLMYQFVVSIRQNTRRK